MLFFDYFHERSKDLIELVLAALEERCEVFEKLMLLGASLLRVIVLGGHESVFRGEIRLGEGEVKLVGLMGWGHGTTVREGVFQGIDVADVRV